MPHPLTQLSRYVLRKPERKVKRQHLKSDSAALLCLVSYCSSPPAIRHLSHGKSWLQNYLYGAKLIQSFENIENKAGVTKLKALLLLLAYCNHCLSHETTRQGGMNAKRVTSGNLLSFLATLVSHASSISKSCLKYC